MSNAPTNAATTTMAPIMPYISMFGIPGAEVFGVNIIVLDRLLPFTEIEPGDNEVEYPVTSTTEQEYVPLVRLNAKDVTLIVPDFMLLIRFTYHVVLAARPDSFNVTVYVNFEKQIGSDVFFLFALQYVFS
jgi:hypothetical protein